MFKQKKIIFSLFLFFSSIQAYDNPHFWRTTNFFSFYDEPRLEKPWLTSFDATIGYGTASKSRNSCSSQTELLNIYGPHNMVKLGSGVPCKDLTNVLDLILTNLSCLPCRCNFGHFLFCGKFEVLESYISFIQNFNRGLFFQVIVPIRKLEITDVCFSDLSPCDQVFPDINTNEWQAFLNSYNSIMSRYCLCANCFKETGVGDIALIGGWTMNYQETNVLDYLDATFRVGVLVPTGKEKDVNNAFSLPLGYDGHIGIPIRFNLAFGAYDWLTIGGNLGGIVFANHTTCLRMKTDCNQNGFIKLAQGQAQVSKGSIWDTSVYFKGDHFVRGLSFLIGYSFVTRREDKVAPCDPICFNAEKVQCDGPFLEWKMHTVHFILEYDFTKPNSRFGPRFGGFYNLQVGGKRVFKTNVGGGAFGLEINWQF